MDVSNILKKLNSRDTKLIPFLPKFNKSFKIVSILIVFVFLTFLTKQILAAATTVDTSDAVQGFQNKQSAMKTGNNQESWLNEAAGSNLMVVNNALLGDVPEDVLKGNTSTSWVPNGIVGLTTKSIASLYHQPVSGVEYIAQTVDNFLGKPAYAATSGYNGLSSLIPLWKGFRNATYAIFSLVFIMIGIMIMLRVKISQNAVITIQSAIPKLITSLILVTFSYAIVGLLIDLSYVVENIGLTLVLNASGSSELAKNIISDPNIYGRIFSLAPVAAIASISAIIAILIAVLSGGLLAPASIIGFILVIAVLAIIILVYTIKFFIGLIACYLKILLLTIFSPLAIALGAIPNMKMGFGTWIMHVIANILVFPISIIFLVTIKAVMTAISASSNLWTPTGLEGFSGGGLLSVAVGIGALVLVSKLPKMIPEFIFQIKPSPWGKAIGEGFGVYGKFAKGTASSSAKAGVDYADQRFGDGDATWQKGLRATNRILGGKYSRKRIEDASITQSDDKL